MRRLVGRHAVIRVLVVWVIMAVTLYVLSAFIPEIDFPGWGSAFAIAAVIGLLNAVVWPLFVRFALPITVLTLGVAALLLNGVIVSIASSIVDGFGVGVLWGIVATFILTVVNTVVTSLLGIDDDDFYYRNVIQRAAARQGATSSDVPGVVFLEIDGLAHEVVVRALRNGNMPMVGRWLREGTHHLIRWETDWSSQTGACQAGLLHGNSEDWPAFRWWEKEHKRPIVTNHPKDAAELERRHSNGRGLLHEDGASREHLSGDAKHSLLTMSTVLRRDRPGRIGQDYFAYFANPYNITRTVMLALADIAQELYYAAQQRRRDIRPRIKRTLTYALVRSWATVIQRELQVSAIIGDLYAGRPVAYTTFLAYDEVAHHSGIERPDALSVLRKIDRQFARIEQAAKGPAPVLSRGPLRPRSITGRHLPRALWHVAGGYRARGVRHRQHPHGRRRKQRGSRIPWRIADRSGVSRQRSRPHDPRGDEEQAGRRCCATRREISRRDRKDARRGAGRPNARTVGDGLGLPGAHLVPTRARAAYARAHRASLPRARPGAARPSRHRLHASALRAAWGCGDWRSGNALP